MPADKLGGGMHDDICPMLNGTNQIRRSEGVVDHQRYPVGMGSLCHRLDICDI